MPLQIVRDDITKIKCDAIVNAANTSLLGGGGVDGAIHRAAGPELLDECRKLGGCETGKAKITKAYNLNAKYVIHTVGPVWHGGMYGEGDLLKSCYKESLVLAQKYECESVAFPLISAGVYGYPVREAFQIATDTVLDFLKHSDITVTIVVFDKNALFASEQLLFDVKQYIDDNYVDSHTFERSRSVSFENDMCDYGKAMPFNAENHVPTICANKSYKDLDSVINEVMDESFSQMLLRKIDESGMKDSECYKKANIDKRLFSKIRSNVTYKPSKATVLAFCVALELDLYETQEMLMKAGFAFSHSSKFDVIVEYFIKNRQYNIFEINEALFAFDQVLLGQN